MQIRAIAEGEVSAFRRCLIETFGGDLARDTDGEERFDALVDRSRAFAAFDGDALVGTAAGYDLALSVPGGSVPMAGLSMVSVRPTHRRRGVLRGLLAAYLDAARRHGDPLSGLWASEATIYGRFGYGIAQESDALSWSATAAAVVAPAGELGALDAIELIEGETAAKLLPDVYDAALAARPGLFARSPAWWKHRRFAEGYDHRTGASLRRHAVARRSGAPTGYLVYRQRPSWESGVPTGALEIEEFLALDPRAETSLWHFASHVDLFPRVSCRNSPVDALLPWLLDNPRALARRRSEGLWLRIDDVPAALAARSYSADGSLRLAVDGELHELRVRAGRASCEPASGAPDLRLDRAALGSLYLGAFAPSLLARAGRIAGDPEALALADRLFAWPVAPWCPEIF